MFQHFYLKYKKCIIKSAGDRFELPLPDHESSMQPLHQPAFLSLYSFMKLNRILFFINPARGQHMSPARGRIILNHL